MSFGETNPFRSKDNRYYFLCDNDLIGVCSILFLSEKTFYSLKDGSLVDDMLLSHEDIVHVKNGDPLHIYVSCIAIDSAYRGKNLSAYLLDTVLTEIYSEYPDSKKHCLSLCITEASSTIHSKCGFSLIKENSTGDKVMYKY